MGTTVICERCGRDCPATQRFCGWCGASLDRACPACGANNPGESRFCASCGVAVDTWRPLGEERRWVTVVFADLSGFTSASEKMDPEDVRAMVAPGLSSLSGIVEEYGGWVNRIIGDAVLAVFGAPVAHEDDAERAVRAALEMQRRVSECPADFGGLRLRVGVNTGEVMFGAVGPDPNLTVMGDVVNTASRLQSAADPGQVVVGSDTHAASRAIRYEPVPRLSVKGKAEPVSAWSALRPLTAPARRPMSSAPMVGRQAEFEMLTSIWRRVTRDREPHLVTLVGDSGIGKSTLARRDITRSRAGRGARIACRLASLRGASPVRRVRPNAQGPRRHLRERRRSQLAVQARRMYRAAAPREQGRHARGSMDSPATPRPHRVSRRSQGRKRSGGSACTVWRGAAASGGARARGTDTACFRGSALGGTERPRSRRVVGGPSEGRSGVLLGAGPSRTARCPAAMGQRAGVLHGVTTRSAETTRCSRTRPVAARRPRRSRDRVARPAHGGRESALRRRARGVGLRRAHADVASSPHHRQIDHHRVAGRVAGPTASPAPRGVGHRRRVLGRGARRASRGEAATEELLEDLERRDFVRREPSSRIQGDFEFSFKHDLIREVAYSTVPKAVRQQRHGATAEYLEQAGAGTEGSAAILALHWREAGNSERAIEYLLAAAEYAGRGWAKDEAVRLYSQALELIPPDDHARRKDVTVSRAVARLMFVHAVFQADQLRTPVPRGREDG